MAQLRITARMYIGAPSGCLGLRGAAARRSATWPFALVGLRATSHTCDSLCEIPFELPRLRTRDSYRKAGVFLHADSLG